MSAHATLHPETLNRFFEIDCYPSEGTSAIWTTRVIKAILALERNNVYWPDENERKAIDRHFEEEEDIPDGCVGIIDGFHVPFAYKPARHDAVDFFSYKS